MSLDNSDPDLDVRDDSAPERPVLPFVRPSDRRRFVMRYTIVEPRGSISFVGPCQGLKALVAACAQQAPPTAEALLDAAGEYDTALRDAALNGLRIFDEHNVPGDYAAIHAALEGDKARQAETPVFRVVDEITREASLTPVKSGLVLFNLKQKRIIQVHNTYAEVQREDRGRVRKNGRVTGRFYEYRLPVDWQILP
jgi:hypothetical protein